MIDDMKQRTQSFMRLKITIVSGFEQPHKEHQAILVACESNNVELGVKLIREHILRTKKEVTAYFRRENISRMNR